MVQLLLLTVLIEERYLQFDTVQALLQPTLTALKCSSEVLIFVPRSQQLLCQLAFVASLTLDQRTLL